MALESAKIGMFPHLGKNQRLISPLTSNASLSPSPTPIEQLRCRGPCTGVPFPCQLLVENDASSSFYVLKDCLVCWHGLSPRGPTALNSVLTDQ